MKYIALLRGINVGGKRKILMADLKALLASIGFEDVVTYIQSGNVIFKNDKPEDIAAMEQNIASTILEKYGFEVPVIVRSVDDFHKAASQNPFIPKNEDFDIKTVHLTFLKEKPSKEAQEKAESYNYEPDRFSIQGQSVYIYCAGKYHQTKLSNTFFEQKLKTACTTRNWKTVMKLVELSTS